MSDDAFGVLMALVMVSDPWPLKAGKSQMDELLDEEARSRGFCDWIAAYHEWPTPLNQPTPGE
jgi:hypothetical protein